MAKYSNGNFDNSIIDAIYELILHYFQNNVSYHLGVIDLYSLSAENKELWSDGVHFQRGAYEKFADLIIETVDKHLI